MWELEYLHLEGPQGYCNFREEYDLVAPGTMKSLWRGGVSLQRTSLGMHSWGCMSVQQIRKVVAFRYQSLDQASHTHYFVPSLKQSQEIGTVLLSLLQS